MRPRTDQRLASLLIASLAVLWTGCGSDTVVTPPDCAGSRLVVFASDSPGTFDIFLFDFDGSGFRLLAKLNSATAADSNPGITIDSRVVAFESDRSGNQDILLFDRCAADFIAQPGLVTADDEKDPCFTWDGRRLAFARDTLGDLRIRLIEGASDLLVPLPGLDAAVGFDDWSPAPDLRGNRIAFLSNRNGNPDLFVYDAGGDSLLTLPSLISPGEEADPWLSSDGRWVAFASNRSGGAGDFDVYLYDILNHGFVAVGTGVNGPDRESGPCFSFDRSRLLFTSNRSGNQGGQDLYTYTTGAAAPVRSISSTTGWDAAPYLLYP